MVPNSTLGSRLKIYIHMNKMINKILLENYKYYFHPKYTAYAGSLDGYIVYAAAQKPTLGTPNENEYMEMKTEKDWPRIFIHDFIWECFYGP